MDCCQGIGLLHCGLLSRYWTDALWTAVWDMDYYAIVLCQSFELLHCGLLSKYWTVALWTAVRTLDCYVMACCQVTGPFDGVVLSRYQLFNGVIVHWVLSHYNFCCDYG